MPTRCPDSSWRAARIVALAVLLLGGCAPGLQDSPSAPGVDEAAAPAADDREPRYLAGVESAAEAAPLTRVRTIDLQVPDGFPPPSAVVSVAVGGDSLYLLDFPTSTVWRFTLEGRFIRRFGQSPNPRMAIRRGIDLHFHEPDQTLYVANSSQGLLLFDSSGEVLRKSEEPRYAYSVAGLPHGRLAVCFSKIGGPHWAILEGDAVAATFYSQRRTLLPNGDEFIRTYTPHSFADVDGDGNIYVGAQGLPQIRKYRTDGSYLGDFRMQEDPHLPPVPPRLTEEQKQRRSNFGEMPDFTRLIRLCVAHDRYLVVQFHAPGGGTRLHFYTLDGRAAFRPQSWSTRLMTKDAEGRLYFKEPGHRLSVYTLQPAVGEEEP